eukprot:13074953-Alexandrium_andersonii.AAC.1
MGFRSRLHPVLVALLGVGLGGQIQWPERHLDFAEFFAGDQAISSCVRAFGMRVMSIDARYGESYDLLTPHGFLASVRVVCSVKPG